MMYRKKLEECVSRRLQYSGESGEIERLSEKVDNLTEAVGVLSALLVEHTDTPVDDLEEHLPGGYVCELPGSQDESELSPNELKELWKGLMDVSANDWGEINGPYDRWPSGTNMTDIHKWFNDELPHGLCNMLMSMGLERGT